MYTDLKQAIVTMLAESKIFTKVYDYEPMAMESYPCVCVSAKRHSSEDSAYSGLGHTRQKETYVFMLTICYGLTQNDGKTSDEARRWAEKVILQKVDELLDYLAKHRQIGTQGAWSNPVSSEIGETQREMVVRYAQVTLEVTVDTRRD